jgi:hypothetical protein
MTGDVVNSDRDVIDRRILLCCQRPIELHPACEELGLQMPGRAAIARALAVPTERVPRDLAEPPPGRVAGIVRALLHDLRAVGTANLARVELPERVAPQDVPRVEAGVVDRSVVPKKTPGRIQTSWMARPSRTQPKWISPRPLCVVPSSACTTVSISQLPISQP